MIAKDLKNANYIQQAKSQKGVHVEKQDRKKKDLGNYHKGFITLYNSFKRQPTKKQQINLLNS